MVQWHPNHYQLLPTFERLHTFVKHPSRPFLQETTFHPPTNPSLMISFFLQTQSYHLPFLLTQTVDMLDSLVKQQINLWGTLPQSEGQL
jgi:hypothetical protein